MSAPPVGWAKIRLGDIAAQSSNVDPSRALRETFELYSVPSFSTGMPDQVQGQEIKSSKQSVQPDDVLLCKIVPHLNRVWTVAPSRGHRQIASGEWIVYRDHHCEPHYLRYCLTEQSFREKFMTTVSGVGGSLMRARPSAVAEIEIPIAPLAEQRRIVEKINSLLAKSKRTRNQLDHVLRLVEKYKHAILAAAFRGDLTRDWRLTNEYYEPPLHTLRQVRKGRSQSKKLSKRKVVHTVPDTTLPKSWEWVSPDELADNSAYSIGIGPFGSNLVRSDYRENGVRLIFVRDIKRERFDDDGARYVTPEKASELHQHLVEGGMVLITKMGEPPGDTAFYPLGSEPAVITADCIKLRPHPKLADATYIVYCIRSDVVSQQIEQITKGVAHQKVSLDRFRTIALPIPSIAEQTEIVRRIEAALACVDRLASECTSAQKLIDHLDQTILAKAFRGELVPQDPSDEPASILLERIRS